MRVPESLLRFVDTDVSVTTISINFSPDEPRER